MIIPKICKVPACKKYSEHLIIKLRGRDGHGYVVAYPGNWKRALALWPKVFWKWNFNPA